MNYYIHIPFCRSKCKYCHFASFEGIEDGLKTYYLDFLKKEIKIFLSQNKDKKTDSIYFGGGTPSTLSVNEIRGILDCFGDFIQKDTEITLEANPEYINREYMNGLNDLGINRLSLGVQTLQEKSLAEVGRYNLENIYSSLEILEEINFPNVGVDFIIGLPYTEEGDTKKDIKYLLEKYNIIKHMSVYMLEEGKYPDNWKEISIREEDLGKEYEEVANFLEKKGFARYELSNFAKDGYKCRHNSGYWNHSNYRGFGLSAASFIDNRRFANNSSFIGYYTGKLDYNEELSTEDLELEKMMFDFRTIGVGSNLVKNFNKSEEFKSDFLISNSGNLVKLTNKGISIADYIFKELFL